MFKEIKAQIVSSLFPKFHFLSYLVKVKIEFNIRIFLPLCRCFLSILLHKSDKSSRLDWLIFPFAFEGLKLFSKFGFDYDIFFHFRFSLCQLLLSKLNNNLFNCAWINCIYDVNEVLSWRSLLFRIIWHVYVNQRIIFYFRPQNGCFNLAILRNIDASFDLIDLK